MTDADKIHALTLIVSKQAARLDHLQADIQALRANQLLRDGEKPLQEPPTPPQRMHDIADAVAIANMMTVGQLRGSGACRQFSWPRQDAYRRAYDAGIPLGGIARFFDRDQSTVVHGIRASRKRAAK